MRPLVIIPTYNERDNLSVLVRELLDIPRVCLLIVETVHLVLGGVVIVGLNALDALVWERRRAPRAISVAVVCGQSRLR